MITRKFQRQGRHAGAFMRVQSLEIWENDGGKKTCEESNFCIRQHMNLCCLSYPKVILLI